MLESIYLLLLAIATLGLSLKIVYEQDKLGDKKTKGAFIRWVVLFCAGLFFLGHSIALALPHLKSATFALYL